MLNYDPVSSKDGLTGSSILWQVIVLSICRLFINTARRFIYPFAPVLSRGLGVPLTAITAIIAVNQGTSILGIVSGPLADRVGYRRMLMAGMAILALAMLVGGVTSFYWVVFISLVTAGFAKIIYDPAAQAFIGDNVPFNRRSRIVGILELSWAGCTLAGIPLIGILMTRFNWHAPFFAIGVLGVAGFVLIGFMMPADTLVHDSAGSRVSTLAKSWVLLAHNRAALGAVGFAFFASLANDNLFVVYGVWMEKTMHLSAEAIGFSTIAIGVAELSGEIFTVFFSDRIGLKRAVPMGIVLSTLSYGLIPLAGTRLTFALFALFFIFLFFEYTYVSFMALSTEIMPKSRATIVAGVYVSGGIGRIFGALMGVPVWDYGGIKAVASVSVLMSAVGLGLMLWGLGKTKTRIK